MKKILTMILAVVMLAGVLSGCGGSNKSKSQKSTSNAATTIRVGDIMALGTVSPFVADDLGYFDKAGMDVKISEFSDGSALAEAFAAGEIDVAFIGITPTATWYQKGVDLQVIASANGGGHVILTRSDSGINSVKDLKGKILAEPNLGTVTDTLLRDHILPKAGLNPKKDLTIEPGLKPADMASSLFATKEVDAILTWEPYVAQAIAQYKDEVKVLYDSPAEIKNITKSDTFYPVNVVVASQDFIDNHSKELQKFIDVYKDTVNYINTDEGANAEIAKVLKMEESIIKSARKRVDFTYKIDKKGLNKTLTWAKDLGYLDKIPDAKKLYNTKFIE